MLAKLKGKVLELDISMKPFCLVNCVFTVGDDRSCIVYLDDLHSRSHEPLHIVHIDTKVSNRVCDAPDKS